METKSPTRFPVIGAAVCRVPTLALTLLLVGGAFLTSADVIDNLPLEIRTSLSAATPQVIAYQQPNNQSGYYESPLEYGAQATLDPSAPNVIRNVTVPYYSNYGLVGGLVLRVYANDGALVGTTPSPGTLLSEVFTDVKGGGLTTLSVGYGYNAQNVLPPTVTVTLTFSGIGGDNTAGWYLSTADSLAGVHPDFFWVRDADSGWARKSYAVVPEPGVVPLLAVGGMALGAFGFVRSRLHWGAHAPSRVGRGALASGPARHGTLTGGGSAGPTRTARVGREAALFTSSSILPSATREGACGPQCSPIVMPVLRALASVQSISRGAHAPSRVGRGALASASTRHDSR